jgi:site-specific DNA recombinase
MSEEQIAAIVDAFGGLLGLLRQADQLDRAEIYTRIGLQMIYRPDTETVLAEVRSNDIDRVPKWCPGIDTNQYPISADLGSRSYSSLAAPRLRRAPPTGRRTK